VKAQYGQLLDLSDGLLVPAGAELKKLRDASVAAHKVSEFAAARLRASRLTGPATLVQTREASLQLKVAGQAEAEEAWRRAVATARAQADALQRSAWPRGSTTAQQQRPSVATAVALALRRMAEAEQFCADATAAEAAQRTVEVACAASGVAVEQLVEQFSGNGAVPVTKAQRDRARASLPAAVASLLSGEAAADAAWARRSHAGWAAVEGLLRAADGSASAAKALDGTVASAGSLAAAASAEALATVQQAALVFEAHGALVRARLAVAAAVLEGSSSDAAVLEGSSSDDAHEHTEASADDEDRAEEEAALRAFQAADEAIAAAAGGSALLASALALSTAAQTASVAQCAADADAARHGAEVEAQRLEAWAAGAKQRLAEGCRDFEAKCLRVHVAQRRFEALRHPTASALHEEDKQEEEEGGAVEGADAEVVAPLSPVAQRKHDESKTKARLQERLLRDSREVSFRT
jgi:exonuclease SbcC